MFEDDPLKDDVLDEIEAGWAIDDASRDFEDSLMVHRYLKDMHIDGWRIELGRYDGRMWEARLTSPEFPGTVVGRAQTRLSALIEVHHEAFRTLGHFPEERRRRNNKSI